MNLSDLELRVKLQDLRVLMAVVQAGSMNKAAALLHTTQPSVSRSIGELERAIGARLLDRGPQGVEPTAHGRALLDCGAAVFDELRQGMRSIQHLDDPTAGEVRIGSIIPLAASFVSTVVERLSRRHPRIQVHVLATQTEGLYRDLHERNVDLLIARKFGPLADERLAFEFLFDASFVVVAGAQSPWVRRRKIELADLVDEPWALPPPDIATASVAREAFRASGLDYPRAAVFTAPAEVRMGLVATGRFLTILEASLLRFPTRHPEIKVLPVELPLARVPNGIVTLKNRTLSPVARLFAEYAREVAGPLAG
jgi:DNA-binding transcriptional LysR family regulator